MKLSLQRGNRFGEVLHRLVCAGEAGEAVAQGVIQAEGSRACEQHGEALGRQVGGKGAIQPLNGVGSGELLVDALQGGAHPFRLDSGRDGNAGEVNELGGEAEEKVGEGGH